MVLVAVLVLVCGDDGGGVVGDVGGCLCGGGVAVVGVIVITGCVTDDIVGVGVWDYVVDVVVVVWCVCVCVDVVVVYVVSGCVAAGIDGGGVIGGFGYGDVADMLR